MLKRILAAWQAVWASPCAGGALLRWGVLCVAVLGVAVALQLGGVFERVDEWQLRVLAGHPFYITAEDAQVSLLGPGGTWGVSVGLVLYLGAVLLQQQRLSRRNHLCLLAAVAVALPGLMCVLWHGVLYVGLPLVCIFLLWVALVPLPLVRRLFS